VQACWGACSHGDCCKPIAKSLYLKQVALRRMHRKLIAPPLLPQRG
jgi:hypothetical protein